MTKEVCMGDEFVCIKVATTNAEMFRVGDVYAITKISSSYLWPYCMNDGAFTFDELHGNTDSLNISQASFHPVSYYTNKQLFTFKMTGKIP